jgi:anaerobic selenocysteine-containing dehydrogenase
MMMGMQRHAGGGSAVRAIMSLSALTGDWQYPGGGAAYEIFSRFGFDYDALRGEHLRQNPETDRTLVVTRLGEGLLELDDPPVMSLFLWGSNPLASSPNTEKIRQGLARGDLFTVVSDHFMTETARFADVFLPSAMQMEQDDFLASYGHIYLHWNGKAVEPPGECLPLSEIFRRLARAMKLEEPSLYATDDELLEAALGSGHPSFEGITPERLKREGFVRLAYEDDTPATEIGFPTPSGKIEFVSGTMAALGLDPVPGYVPPEEAASADADHPFALLTPATHYYLNSIFGNYAPSTSRQGEQTVAMHPEDCAANGLVEGDLVRVHNTRGGYTARLVESDVIRPGLLMSPKGQWQGPDGTPANVNATVDERDSDMGRGAVYNDNRVAVTKLPALAAELAPE